MKKVKIFLLIALLPLSNLIILYGQSDTLCVGGVIINTPEDFEELLPDEFNTAIYPNEMDYGETSVKHLSSDSIDIFYNLVGDSTSFGSAVVKCRSCLIEFGVHKFFIESRASTVFEQRLDDLYEYLQGDSTEISKGNFNRLTSYPLGEFEFRTSEKAIMQLGFEEGRVLDLLIIKEE